ncbi:MAG: hypothetical protein AAGA94_06925 [Pseudomonadota bacterium]
MKRAFTALVGIMGLLFLAGCGVPTESQTVQEQAAVASVQSHQAVVTRRTGFTGGAFPVIITLDSVEVASIPLNQTRTFNVPPGKHVLRATSGLLAPAELTFTKANGKPVFFNVSLRTGLIGSSLQLTQVVRN